MSKLHNVHTASEESSMNQDVDMFLVFANMIMQKKIWALPYPQKYQTSQWSSKSRVHTHGCESKAAPPNHVRLTSAIYMYYINMLAPPKPNFCPWMQSFKKLILLRADATEALIEDSL